MTTYTYPDLFAALEAAAIIDPETMRMCVPCIQQFQRTLIPLDVAKQMVVDASAHEWVDGRLNLDGGRYQFPEVTAS